MVILVETEALLSFQVVAGDSPEKLWPRALGLAGWLW